MIYHTENVSLSLRKIGLFDLLEKKFFEIDCDVAASISLAEGVWKE